MIFENIKSITIPEGEVKRILYGSVVLWQKIISKIVNFIDALVIQDGVKRNIESLTQYGKCEQNGTPTPSAPIDIKCNNGTLGIISEGIPEEYIRLEYLQSSGTQYIDTGIAINYATQNIEQTATIRYTQSNSNRELMGTNGYGFFGKSASNKLESASGSTSPVIESALSKSIVSLMTDPSTKTVTFNVNGKQYTANASTFANNSYSIYIFALGGRDGVAASFFCNARVYDYIIKINGIILAHLLPVKRRSDGVLGMYDIVTNTFKTNAGTGTFIAGPTDSVATINNVPSEYIELEYLESSGTQYIDTGIVPSLDLTAEAEYFGGANYAAYGARWSGTPDNDTYGIYRSAYTDGGGARLIAYYGRYGNGKYGNFVVNSAPRFRTYIGTDSATVNEITLPISRESLSTNLTMYLFAMNKDNTAAFGGMVRIYSLKFFRNGQAIADYIPCKRRSDGTLGMYDAVTNTFKTNDGTGTFVAGPAVNHIGIIGIPEVITVSGANLLDPTTVSDENAFISRSNGTEVPPSATGGTFRHSDYIPIVSGETYYFGITPYQASTAGLAWYNGNSYVSGINGTALKNAGMKATAPNGATHVRFSWRIDEDYDTDWEHSIYFCVDGDIDRFVPYSVQTANAEDLLGLGDVVDEQDIISGEVTRKVGVKILDGTEEWETDTYGGNRRFVTRNFAKEQLSTVVCTHYSSTIEDGVRTAPNNAYVAATGALAIYRASAQSIDTVADWTAYLAAQYTNGTPVIVLYLLTTETTEEVTPQSLYFVEDTNTISVSAEVSDIDFEIKYKAKVI